MLLQLVVRQFSDTSVEANGFIAGMLALGLVFAAYASEVFTAAFNGIPKGQWEGAAAIGLHRWQTMRFVILPQLIRIALPGLANLWLILLKDTSLVSVIAFNDLLRMTSVAVGTTKEPFFFYFIACMIYLFFSIVSSFGIGAIERHAERGESERAPVRAAMPQPVTQ
jgi:polar amino acid transport system permease protein